MAANPFEERWWLGTDSPFQLLAACLDLSDALELDDPTSHVSHIAVHQDGSCNGLQHYAGLSLDPQGAVLVNVIPADRVEPYKDRGPTGGGAIASQYEGFRPADPYAGVANILNSGNFGNMGEDGVDGIAEKMRDQEMKKFGLGQDNVEGDGEGGEALQDSAGGDPVLSLEQLMAQEESSLLPDEEAPEHERAQEQLAKALSEEMVDGDAETEMRKMHQALVGNIKRKTIKQTVMTTVYGVTLVGARDQIYERLSEDPKLQQYEESDLRKMALWLAKETMDQVDRQFPGAARVMAWLRQVATARPNTILSERNG